MTGERAVKALTDLQDSLPAVGETRRGTIDYASEAELLEELAEHCRQN